MVAYIETMLRRNTEQNENNQINLMEKYFDLLVNHGCKLNDLNV
jgi:hypothetical protein